MTACQTKRLILTPLKSQHGAELYKLHNDPLVQNAIFNNVPQTRADVHKWIDRFLAQWSKSGFGFWIVYEKVNDSPIFIGRCGLLEYGDTANLEFAYAFFQSGAGRGLGPEAARFAITHALQNSTKEKVIGFIAHGNTRAERAAEKFGLHYVDDRFDNGKLFQYYEVSREDYCSQAHYQA
ncbi:GNAT family N-acetyltransferase (plasmid) [Rhizobium sp. CB3090]|uniref:GNAT family N-acetyltransferase n=1 Tax=Rhizobium sp. CB3090 TaxID=3039156 RepID=UPI0024B16BE1|nr:GNAT family N-acetyltransferase [Rhizobium sp. CB3090]WFU12798.1 GNAT family N-acetyltransferase [Rhizobium sp. CB3090]